MSPSSLAVLAQESSSSDGNFASFEVAPWIWVAFLAFVTALLARPAAGPPQAARPDQGSGRRVGGVDHDRRGFGA